MAKQGSVSGQSEKAGCNRDERDKGRRGRKKDCRTCDSMTTKRNQAPATCDKPVLRHAPTLGLEDR